MDEREIAALIETIVRKYDGHFDWLIRRREEPLREPEPEHWRALAEKFGCEFPSAFMSFMTLMSGYFTPGHLDAVAGNSPDGDSIAAAYDSEMERGPWLPDLIPFHDVGNGDYHCLSAAAGERSPVFYVSHERTGPDSVEPIAASFEDWLRRLEYHLGGDYAEMAEEDVPRPPPGGDAARNRLAQAFVAAAVTLERWNRPG